MLNAHNKGKFRNGHATEIDLYQKARDILRSYTPEGRFPSLKSQQARNTKLLKLQKAQSVELENIRKNERTISIAAQNVHYIMEGAVKRVPIAHREGLQNTWKIIRNSHSLSIAIVAEEKCRYVYLSRQYNNWTVKS